MALLPDPLYSVEQTRQLDQLAIDAGVSANELMNRAGSAVMQLILEKFPGTGNMLVVCGKGNNAGDGYVVARLAKSHGIEAKVLPLVPLEELTGAAYQAAHEWNEEGGLMATWVDFSRHHDVVVDALFGTGLSRVVDGENADVIACINKHKKEFGSKVVAVDVPSGIKADTGSILGCAVEADMTMSVIGLNQGVMTGYAPHYTGEVFFNRLGLSDELIESVNPVSKRINAESLSQALPARSAISHKGTHGHVLVIGGNEGMMGAPLLSGLAALRTGAGLVSIATHPIHAAIMNVHQPELMCHGVAGPNDLQALIDNASVIAIGPGLGQDEWAKSLFDTVVLADKPLVVDADALNLLSKHYVERRDWVLTPHPTEASRLAGMDTDQIQQDRFNASRSLSSHYNATVVLKGAGTLVTEQDGATFLNTSGNPALASGGMGDCLTGIIAALIAQCGDIPLSARAGVYLHGAAADRLAKTQGNRGIIATDLLDPIQRLVN